MNCISYYLLNKNLMSLTSTSLW